MAKRSRDERGVRADKWDRAVEQAMTPIVDILARRDGAIVSRLVDLGASPEHFDLEQGAPPGGREASAAEEQGGAPSEVERLASARRAIWRVAEYELCVAEYDVAEARPELAKSLVRDSFRFGRAAHGTERVCAPAMPRGIEDAFWAVELRFADEFESRTRSDALAGAGFQAKARRLRLMVDPRLQGHVEGIENELRGVERTRELQSVAWRSERRRRVERASQRFSKILPATEVSGRLAARAEPGAYPFVSPESVRRTAEAAGLERARQGLEEGLRRLDSRYVDGFEALRESRLAAEQWYQEGVALFSELHRLRAQEREAREVELRHARAVRVREARRGARGPSNGGGRGR